MLEMIRSGGQTGSDIGAIKAAVAKGIATGGLLPKGFKTQDGPKPEYAELYGMREHSSSSYPPRTFENVRDSDGTIRIAYNLESSGERCTLKAIKQYNKPYFDVWVRDTSLYTTLEYQTPAVAAKWILDNGIKILNVAGNAESTASGIEAFATRYVAAMIDELNRLHILEGGNVKIR